MKKMKTRTKLAGAVTALVVAVALSAGTTFAWFTTSKTVSVTTISASVTSTSGGLEIASGLNKESGFGSSLTVDASSVVLDAATTSIDGATGAVTMLNRKNEAATEGSYITFNCTLRAQSDLVINLGAGSDVSSTAATSPNYVKAWADTTNSSTSAVTNTKYGNGDIDIGNNIEAKAANASRVSFEMGTYSGSNVDSMTVSSSKVWSPHEASINGKYIADSTALSGLSSTEANSDKAGFYMGNLASDYEQYLLANSLMTYAELDTATGYTSHWGALGSSYPYTGAAYTQDTTGYANPVVPIESNSQTTSGTNTTIVTLASFGDYYYANVTVKIWLEGTDGDCLNSIFSQTLKVDLEFVGIAS